MSIPRIRSESIWGGCLHSDPPALAAPGHIEYSLARFKPAGGFPAMPGLFGRLMPRSQSFSTAFTSLAENTHEGSAVFVEMLEKYDGAERYVERIKEIEHAGDNMTHALLTHLNQTFITPFDREDIYMLAGRVDDVLDLIDAAARAFATYRIAHVR